MTIENLSDYRLPRWEELPDLGLYLDQVQIVLDQVLPKTQDKGGNITGTMITNYVKQKVVSPTEKKKYYRRHIAQLIIVFLLKHVLSTAEMIPVLNDIADGRELADGYDDFCSELEKRLSSGDNEETSESTNVSEITAAAVDALAGKLKFELLISEKDQAE